MTMSKVAPAMPTNTAARTVAIRSACGIDQRQVDHGGDHQGAGEQQPGHALAQPADQRQAHAIDHPGPQELEVVDQKCQRERGDGLLVDAVLRQPRGQRGADHRVGKARGHAEEQRRQRRGLGVRAHARGQVAAPVGGDRECLRSSAKTTVPAAASEASSATFAQSCASSRLPGGQKAGVAAALQPVSCDRFAVHARLPGPRHR